MVRPTKQQYLLRIARHFPQVRHKTASLVRRGWDNDVVILDDRLVFRFPKPSYRERFKVELRILEYLRDRVSLRVPHYSYLPEDRSFGGYPIIPGRPLRPSVFKRLSRSSRQRIARDLGAFLTVMHGIPLSQAKTWGIEEEPGGYWWSKAETARRHLAMKEILYPKLNRAERTWLDDSLTDYLSLDFSFHKKLIHSDLTDDHIYVPRDRSKLGGIIDFADAEIADPALDFAGLWPFGREFVVAVMSYYGQDTDRHFLERSRVPYRVHSAANMLEILQGTKIPKSFEQCRRALNRDMILYRD